MRLISTFLTLLILFLTSCSQLQKSNDQTIFREVTAEKSCDELLDHFLPKENRFKYRETEDVTLINGLINNVPKELKLIQDETENTSIDLFRSFAGEAKNLASKSNFKLVVDPKEALLTRVMMIRNAKSSINMTYYIFEDSDASGILINELRAALRRGVDVRLMVDGTGSFNAYLNSFKEISILSQVVGGNILDESGNVVRTAKFEAAIINPLINVNASIKNWYHKIVNLISHKKTPVNDFSIFHRSHDKILLIDAESPEDSMALIGGRNISNQYYELGTENERDSSFKDLDILIKNFTKIDNKDGNPVLYNSLLEHFNRLYYYSANKKFSDFIFTRSRDNLAKKLSEIKKLKNETIFHDGSELNTALNKMYQNDYLNTGFDEGYVQFLNEIGNLIRKNPFKNFDFSNNKNSIISNMWDQMQKAESDILICSPYIYFTTEEIDFFVKWLKENPNRKLRLLTNSTATSDVIVAQALVENFVMPRLFKKLKEENIPSTQYEIMAFGNLKNKEFGGTERQGRIHAKFWMIDNYSVTAGTDNLDPVSRYFNSEIVANVFPTNEENKTVKQLNDYYNKLKSQSTHWYSEEFYKAKLRPEFKKRLIGQNISSKIIKFFKILPNYND